MYDPVPQKVRKCRPTEHGVGPYGRAQSLDRRLYLYILTHIYDDYRML